LERGASQYADWTLKPRQGPGGDAAETVRVHGRLATDNGEQTHDWALAGMGLARHVGQRDERVRHFTGVPCAADAA
jgi:hypothetical protein